MASGHEHQQHLRVVRVSMIVEPTSSIQYVTNPKLAKLKHLINVSGLGLVEVISQYCRPTAGWLLNEGSSKHV